MIKRLIYTLLLVFGTSSYAQFAGPVGSLNTTAIPADSSAFVAWATQCDVQRGWLDISDKSLLKTTLGLPKDALGKSEGFIVSLGDAGVATLQFDKPIYNGPSWDFAVFENAFSDYFLELAFVEVSSDGITFVRFPATCNQSDSLQNGPFDETGRPDLINNLAGKYRGGYGTPFDLEELKDSAAGLNIFRITHVRIIDCVGSVSGSFASYDQNGNAINDPFPTPFSSGGFDLDAVGVIHTTASTNEPLSQNQLWPNPAQNTLHFSKPISQLEIFSSSGQAVFLSTKQGQQYSISSLKNGVYMYKIHENGHSRSGKLMIQR